METCLSWIVFSGWMIVEKKGGNVFTSLIPMAIPRMKNLVRMNRTFCEAHCLGIYIHSVSTWRISMEWRIPRIPPNTPAVKKLCSLSVDRSAVYPVFGSWSVPDTILFLTHCRAVWRPWFFRSFISFSFRRLCPLFSPFSQDCGEWGRKIDEIISLAYNNYSHHIPFTWTVHRIGSLLYRKELRRQQKHS